MSSHALLVAAGCTGCIVGGGPTIGYGPRGTFVGGEVNAGLPVVQLAGGFADHTTYVRADATYDAYAVGCVRHGPGSPFGGRIGGGVGFGDGTTGVFAAGLDAAPLLVDNDVALVGYVELSLRYAHGWQLVLMPRVEVHVARHWSFDQGFDDCAST